MPNNNQKCGRCSVYIFGSSSNTQTFHFINKKGIEKLPSKYSLEINN